MRQFISAVAALGMILCVALIGCNGESGVGIDVDAGETAVEIDAGNTVDGSIPTGDEPDAWVEPDPERLVGRCGDPPPPGAPQPPPLPPYSMGQCPQLVPGVNVISSGGRSREFILVVPADYDPAHDRLPLLVMWHYLGGAADSMLNHGQVQDSADRLRFIAAIPEAAEDLEVGMGSYSFDPVWPYLNTASEARVEEEAVLFDDIIACIAQQYEMDENCVSSVGVSAGALWTAQLAQVRSERLSSVIIISGGIGPATGVGFYDVQGWTGTSHAFPALVGWGGSSDYLGVDFQKASLNLEAKLDENDHFVMECVHNCGHGVPPVNHEIGLGALYRFALDHPYWNEEGRSIYELEGLPEGTPEWCALGAGNASPRVGTCDPEDDINQ